MTEEREDQGKQFDVSKYQITPDAKTQTVVVPETGDEFEIKIKQLAWTRRNQLVSKCLEWGKNGESTFNGDLYIRECLKEMIVEAPWGRTTEAFLISIDERLGTALENLVPTAFTGDAQATQNIKKG
tara:strand:- start:76 stop:456 length:381 start_codon:yes stop_codon:yes gene_type:complete